MKEGGGWGGGLKGQYHEKKFFVAEYMGEKKIRIYYLHFTLSL